MLIESEYLKRQLREMMAAVDDADKDETAISNHAYEMVRSTIRCIERSISVLERARGKGGTGDG